MRITESMITRNYLTNLHSNLSNLQKANEKIASGRKFTRISENVGDGLRALQVRQQMDENYQQQLNVRDAQGVLDTAWDCLRSSEDLMQTARSKVLYALDGGHADQRETVAQELRGIQNSILNFMNTKFADHFIFSGTNNKNQPFTLDNDGRLFYNGVNVDTTPANRVPDNQPFYVDLGMGFKVDANGKVDPRTGFQASYDGFQILGNGETTLTKADGTTFDLPNNYLNLLDNMCDMLENPANYDPEIASAISTKLEESRSEFSLHETEISSRAKFLETTMDRLENEYDNLTISRSGFEAANDYDATMEMKMFEYCWYATLKMGNKILPQSLMDFIQ